MACISVKCIICLCLQSPVSRHSLDVMMEDVSRAHTIVLVLIHVEMAVMKMDVVSTLFTHYETNAHCGTPSTAYSCIRATCTYILARDFSHAYKDKAGQHNKTKRQSHTVQLAQSQHFSKKKLAASGGIRTHNTRILCDTLANAKVKPSHVRGNHFVLLCCAFIFL